ncbi:whi5 like domain-containing protein [Hirsutella rhossiliensis]|uniref:Whi5 like domain-containing protein n=1 Tax=Hirsutella rhossiliensis TaxID=111463 RepID=A0A9P8N0L0_9HYPO|nr:whi5 like domain-containing protein [Hirsutella rhossiliensis]KAH0965948.1 whi5 like domain-containing protein [Hirsutella rhossiliensis]
MDAAAASPLKRRAPLAALDVNVMPSSPRTAGGKDAVLSPAFKRDPGSDDDGGSPPAGTKRQADAEGMDVSPAAKKACLGRDEPRSRSHSPDTSSVFDTSVADASWATMTTTTTEPDLLDRAAPPARRLTREQAREKVEILRLRLGLASYKLRTGQTTVPLADLQPRPLPPRRTVRVQSPPTPSQDSSSSSLSIPQQQRRPSSQLQQLQHDPQQHQPSLDAAPTATTMSRHDEDGSAGGEQHQPQHRALNSSAFIGGGAASGLLSLARGCEMR